MSRKCALESPSRDKSHLLHQYIFAVIAIHHRYDTASRLTCTEAEDIAELEALLDACRDSVRTVQAPRSPIDEASATTRAELPFYQWFVSQESSFEMLWEKMTDETFHLLLRESVLLAAFSIEVLPTT